MSASRRGTLVALLAMAHGVWAEERAPSPPSPVALLADLTPEVVEALKGDPVGASLPGDPAALLERIFAAVPAYHFDAGPVAVDTDRRWFATVSPEDPASPVLELRRWPGDTVVAFYVLEGEVPGEGAPPLAGAKLVRQSPLTAESDTWHWEGVIETPLGPRPIRWIESRVPGVARRLGALVVPGDAGLGVEAMGDLVQESLAVLGRIELRTDAWTVAEGIRQGTTVTLPVLDPPPGDGDEKRDTWQVAEGGSFTLGLPPGIRMRRLDQGVPPPRSVPAAVLWLRGRFADRKGQRVVVGDGMRAGYVSAGIALDPEWTEGRKPPLGAPGSAPIAGEDFPLACEQTGAVAARAERWSEPGFQGQWLVFRLSFKKSGVEIGLPVLSGRQSEALFWIPVTWRGQGQAPAPPPVDPADQFGISFEQFTRIEQKRHPWVEGYLTVPGLRLEVPKAWAPIASMRSDDGFPVTLLNGNRQVVGRLVRLAQGSEALEPTDGGEWVPVRRPSAHRRGAVYRRGDGARLYVTEAGHGLLLVPEEGAAGSVKTEWERMVESAILLRPGSGDAGTRTASDR